MKLGYHYHVPATSKDKIILMPGSQGLFIDSIAPYCENIICFLHSPTMDEKNQCNYQIKSKNIELETIGPHLSVPWRMLRAKSFTSKLSDRKDDVDVLLIRGPSPLLPAMAKRIPELPKALLLVARYKNGVDALPQPKWRKELIRLWSYWNEYQQTKIASKSLTFVNSKLLFNELKNHIPNLVETRTTTIAENDIYIREDTCTTTPFHILFSGRIAAEKGIDDVLHAVAMLNNQGIHCILDIVGSFEKNKSQDKINETIMVLGLKDQVNYHGFKKVGDELLSYYRRADVFVIASRASEGFPRTIWEAFSQSTPVIATSVGSIPLYLQHEKDVLLATPYKPDELVQFLKRLFFEPELRRRLISNGRNLIRENTLDILARKMIQNIEIWLEKSQ